MLSGASCCVFLLLIYVFLTPPTEATTCSATNNVCSTTLRVTSTCTSSTCACSSTDYTAVATGCATPLTSSTPTVRSWDGTNYDLYSGEVFAGESLTLKCDIDPLTVTATVTTFKWYEDGTEVAGQTAQTYTYSTITATTDVQITCQVFDSGLQSSVSSGFNIKGYGNDGTISLSPLISGGKSKITTGTPMVLTCYNFPKDAADKVENVWNDAGSTTTPDLTVAANEIDGNARTCTVQAVANSGRTFASVAAAASYTVPSAAVDATTITAVEIYDPSAAVTIKFGETIDVLCRTTDQDILYKAGDVVWSWTIDGSVEAGETASTLALPTTLTVATHSVICRGAFGGNPVVSSSALSVTVSENLFKVAALPDPTSPIDGGYMKVRCVVFATSLTGLTYAWSYDSKKIANQDDHTIQINPIDNAAHGNGKTYTCTVSKSLYTEAAPTSQINAVAFTIVTAEVSSDNTRTHFGTGNTYILTCTLSATTPGVTYKWFKAETEQTGETSMTYSITATSSEVKYRCQGVFGEAVSVQSPDTFPVTGKDITEVVLTGVASPVEGTTQTYTCTVYTGASVGSITYDIQKDGTSQGTASQHTITSIALTTSDGAWKCAATIGSQTVDSNIITVAAVAKPAKPTVDIPTQLNLGGSYTLTCTSTSHDSTAVYEWVKTTDSGDTTLSSTARTYYISVISSADAAQYKCKLTVNSQPSDFSELVTVTVGDTQGLVCTENTFASDCGTDFTLYTGNCINSRCECVGGVPLYQDTCGSSGSATVAASALVICLGWLTYHLMP